MLLWVLFCVHMPTHMVKDDDSWQQAIRFHCHGQSLSRRPEQPQPTRTHPPTHTHMYCNMHALFLCLSSHVHMLLSSLASHSQRVADIKKLQWQQCVASPWLCFNSFHAEREKKKTERSVLVIIERHLSECVSDVFVLCLRRGSNKARHWSFQARGKWWRQEFTSLEGLRWLLVSGSRNWKHTECLGNHSIKPPPLTKPTRELTDHQLRMAAVWPTI